jgi:two-component system, cell cycle response regulator
VRAGKEAAWPQVPGPPFALCTKYAARVVRLGGEDASEFTPGEVSSGEGRLPFQVSTSAGLSRPGLLRTLRGFAGRLRRALQERNRLVVEAGESGERLVAKVRLASIGLLALIQLTPLLRIGGVPARVAFMSTESMVGRFLTLSAFLAALLIWAGVRYAYRPWMGALSIVVDVTLVSAGLAIFFVLGRPLTAVNSRVVFEVYFLAIASAGLRYDWRLCVLASGLAVAEFAGLSAYAAGHWDMAAMSRRPTGYGDFAWSSQIARMVVLAGAGVMSAAVALRGRRWRYLSGTDGLTGLANRAWFEERLEEEMSRARRRGESLAIAVADLDSFREMNTAHGHAGGDLALQAVARRLRQSIRKSDLAARLGGDEFVLAFPATDAAQAVLRLDGLRLEVAGLRVPIGRGELRLTRSVGVASWPEDGLAFEDVLAKADERTFEAKRLGKNCVVGPAPARVAATAHG